MIYFSDIDDIVLNYVISILEDLGDSENAEENIDVDQFIEMMDAYIPGFGEISRYSMVFNCKRLGVVGALWLERSGMYNILLDMIGFLSDF